MKYLASFDAFYSIGNRSEFELSELTGGSETSSAHDGPPHVRIDVASIETQREAQMKDDSGTLKARAGTVRARSGGWCRHLRALTHKTWVSAILSRRCSHRQRL